MHTYDVIVVGGGPGGLCSAALLAKAGKKVLLLEKEKVLGGRAFSSTYKGHFFDNTAHFPSKAGNLEAVFEELGKPYPENFDKWAGILSYHDEKWASLMDLFDRKHLREMFTEIANTSLEELAKFDKVPLKDWVSAKYDYDGMHLFWWSQAISVYGGADYADYSAGDLLIFIKEHLNRLGRIEGGWIAVKGGLQKLLVPLREALLENGGEIRTDTKVTEIVIENGEAVGVKVEVGKKVVPTMVPPTELIKAPVVIGTLPVWDLPNVLPWSKLTPWYADQLDYVRRKLGTVLVYQYGIGREVKLLGKNWEEPWGLLLPRHLTKSGFNIWGAYVPGYAPAGEHQLIFWYMANYWNFPNALELDNADNRRQLEEIMSRVDEDMEYFFPDLVQNALWKTEHVGMWGLGSFPGFRGGVCPSNEVPGIKGLYLAGDTTREARGVGWQAAARSAMICADLILKK